MDALTLARGALARAGLRPAPLSVAFEISHLCNLACTYCDRHTPLPKEMQRAEIFAALEGLHALGMRHISLDGGEPLAHKHFRDVVDWLVRKRVRVYVNTNGILVPKHLATIRRVQKLKISLDGPKRSHDAMRGERAWERAMVGARVARAEGVPVELTCVLGTHNAGDVDELLDIAEAEGLSVVFQPARNSLFLDNERDGAGFQLDDQRLRAALARVEQRKHRGPGVGNRWSSLRHFRRFPEDAALPCAAGWINVTMDPEGNLHHCGQVSRTGPALNVVALGVRAAFERLLRGGCTQCWCARVVEENYAWGGHFHRLLPPRAGAAGATQSPAPAPKRHLPVAR